MRLTPEEDRKAYGAILTGLRYDADLRRVKSVLEEDPARTQRRLIELRQKARDERR